MPGQEARCQRTADAALTARIRTAIVEGDLVPNQRMVEADLCAQFGASRASVRAALQDLVVEGLAERIQHRGARVRAVSPAEAVEIAEMRTVIDALCAAKAAQKITDSEIEDLGALRAGLTTAAATRDVLEYFRLNQELYRRIRECSGNSSAQTILDRLHALVAHHQSSRLMHPDQMRQSHPEHLAIIDAVCARNPERAEAAVRCHLDRLASEIQPAEHE